MNDDNIIIVISNKHYIVYDHHCMMMRDPHTPHGQFYSNGLKMNGESASVLCQEMWTHNDGSQVQQGTDWRDQIKNIQTATRLRVPAAAGIEEVH